jgi:hypothetical protein
MYLNLKKFIPSLQKINYKNYNFVPVITITNYNYQLPITITIKLQLGKN